MKLLADPQFNLFYCLQCDPVLLYIVCDSTVPLLISSQHSSRVNSTKDWLQHRIFVNSVGLCNRVILTDILVM